MATPEKLRDAMAPSAPRLFSGSETLRVIGRPRTPFADTYHLLLQGSWLRLIGLFAGAFLALNAVFGAIYMELGGIANARHGSFADAFFFSVQTLATIGYGVMYPQTLLAHVLVMTETMLGMLTLAVSTGLVFAKFSRPQARVMFSRLAVVGPRDGVPTLMFRVANQRANHVVEAQMRVALLRSERTVEGEVIRRLHDLQLVRSTTPAFVLTWTAMHAIGPESPLYGVGPEELWAQQGEIIISLLGIDGTTSQTLHARYSYAAEEVRWNHRLADLFGMSPDGRRQLDYSKFHDVEPLPAATPPTDGRSG